MAREGVVNGPLVRLLAGAALLTLVPAGTVTARAGTEEVAVLTTPLGEITWRFLPRDAPEHVKYVKHLIESGFYDGTTLHRVIPHYVVQGGDPNTKNDDRSDDGEGEADRRLKAEFSRRLHYRPGTVGMARQSDPDSGSCQFFIALEDLPRLDGRYTSASFVSMWPARTCCRRSPSRGPSVLSSMPAGPGRFDSSSTPAGTTRVRRRGEGRLWI